MCGYITSAIHRAIMVKMKSCSLVDVFWSQSHLGRWDFSLPTCAKEKVLGFCDTENSWYKWLLSWIFVPWWSLCLFCPIFYSWTCVSVGILKWVEQILTASKTGHTLDYNEYILMKEKWVSYRKKYVYIYIHIYIEKQYPLIHMNRHLKSHFYTWSIPKVGSST